MDTAPTASERKGLQERLEATPAGRGLLGLVIMATLAAILVTNLPSSHLRERLSRTADPYLVATGLDQNWGVFAPDPRNESLGLKARIDYPNGATETWRPPVRGALFGAYSDYRWQKFMENVLGAGPDDGLTRGLAVWVAREQRRSRQLPADVALLKRSASIPPPGAKSERAPPYTELQFVSVPLNARTLRSSRP